MTSPGYLTGRAARRFPAYAYRVPVARPIEHVLDVDPWRLHPAREFPRSVPTPAQASPEIDAEDRCDFEVRIGVRGDDGAYPAEVWLVPSPYSQATAPLRVVSGTIAGGGPLRGLADEFARIAFREG